MKSATVKEPTMTAIPTNEFDAGADRIYSVFKPSQGRNALISRNIDWAHARHIAEYHDALVFCTIDLPEATR